MRNFARKEFWGQHRYAFVLHTDEPHPHVHLVLKAVNEKGMRLNIKKATLRHWRSEFTRNLRLLGVEANATERAVRGECRKAKKDGIYRATLRGNSVSARKRADAVAAELLQGNVRVDSGKRTLVGTRQEIEKGWRAIADNLHNVGHRDLARDVQQFVDGMDPPRTEKELIAARLLGRTRVHEVSR